MKATKGECIFSLINYTILTITTLLIIYPLVYCVSASLSGVTPFLQGKVYLFPVDFTLDAYKYLLEDSSIWIAYGNTIFYTVVGTTVNIVVTVLGAYPLSKRRLRGKSQLNFLLSLTMWLSPGMIPFYLNMYNLHLLDSRASIILGFACTTFNVILMRTYFQNIPEALEEAAKVDGANDLYVLLKIILPISLPSIATVGLFYAVSRWNGYFWAMVLLQSDNKMPLQVLLKKLIVVLNASSEFSTGSDTRHGNMSKETTIYATIVISMLPMLMVYPFIQKYFVKGLMVGSIKG